MLQARERQPQGAGQSRLRPLAAFQGSLANRVYLSLKQAVLAIAYGPGEILRKTEICETLGVSRAPVSDALARLAGDGLVEIVPQAGTFVARFSMREIREGAFLREAIELAAIERVAETIGAEELKDLRRSLRLQEALIADGDQAGFYAEDAAMHALILSFTGFPRLAQVSETAWLHVNRARRLILPVQGRIAATLDEHRAIVEALAAHDPAKARLAARAHLRQLLTYLEPLERERPDLFNPA
jgi:DNA-binding GntR family transcriptional regulator